MARPSAGDDPYLLATPKVPFPFNLRRFHDGEEQVNVRPILVLGLVQLIESLAFALPLSFFISSILGVLATTGVLLLIKEPEKVIES